MVNGTPGRLPLVNSMLLWIVSRGFTLRPLAELKTTENGGFAKLAAQPVWSHEVSNNDKGEFMWAMFQVLRDYDLLTDD